VLTSLKINKACQSLVKVLEVSLERLKKKDKGVEDLSSQVRWLFTFLVRIAN
jgi:hypothetical protein